MDQISVRSNPYGEMLRAPAYLSTIRYETQAGVCVCVCVREIFVLFNRNEKLNAKMKHLAHVDYEFTGTVSMR